MSASITRVAVVVGLCAHGLAIARSLTKERVRVVALESNMDLPGTHTNVATVRRVSDINSDVLIEELVQSAPALSRHGRPVLFLTNDQMVAMVGRHYEELEEYYDLSWANCREALVPLLDKEKIAARCISAKLGMPRTVAVSTRQEFESSLVELGLPLIIKPTTPLSAYKTIIVDSHSSIDLVWETIAAAGRAMVQEYISGDDSHIFFAALYLENGETFARYEGRKLRSRPLGHTTIAIGETNDETHRLAKQFFAGLNLSGPVSLELKRDAAGKYWVIEPTVGRTDFWIGLCVRDGVNVPFIEYARQTGSVTSAIQQQDKVMWINGERDPGALLWLVFHYPLLLVRKVVTGVYASISDPFPLAVCVFRKCLTIPSRLSRKIGVGIWASFRR